MNGKVQPQHVANYFINKAKENGELLSQMKLQKLVYIAYGWVSVFLDEKLFDENIEAWKHGPVIPSLIKEFKDYGERPIVSMARLPENKDIFPKIPESNEDLIYVLDFVWNSYRNFSASKLRRLTHEKGSPWDQVYVSNQRNIVIPFNLIREHFQHLYERYQNNGQKRN